MAQRTVPRHARDELARILHERGDCSVAELAGELGVSQGSVRRHLGIMAADGLLDAARAPAARGRPATRYSLSEAGEERSCAGHYARLLERLLPALASLSADEVAGQTGEAILARVFGKVAEDVARERSPQVRSRELGPRLAEVVAALGDVGILTEAIEEGGAWRLRNAGCPCPATARETGAACEADRYAIELLAGAPVEQTATIAGGAGCCEYRVRKPAGERARGAEAR